MTTPPKFDDLTAAVEDLKARLHEAAPGITTEQLTAVSESLSRLLELSLSLATGMASQTVTLAFDRLTTLEGQMAAGDERIAALEHDQHPPHEREVRM